MSLLLRWMVVLMSVGLNAFLKTWWQELGLKCNKQVLQFKFPNASTQPHTWVQRSQGFALLHLILYLLSTCGSDMCKAPLFLLWLCSCSSVASAFCLWPFIFAAGCHEKPYRSDQPAVDIELLVFGWAQHSAPDAEQMNEASRRADKGEESIHLVVSHGRYILVLLPWKWCLRNNLSVTTYWQSVRLEVERKGVGQ